MAKHDKQPTVRSMHLSSEERAMVEHSRQVGKWIGFAVGFGITVALSFVMPKIWDAFTSTMQNIGAGGTGGIHWGPLGKFMGFLGDNFGLMVLGAGGGLVGANIGANKAQDKALHRITNERAATKEANADLQMQYAAARGMAPTPSYPEHTNRFAQKIEAEQNLQPSGQRL